MSIDYTKFKRVGSHYSKLVAEYNARERIYGFEGKIAVDEEFLALLVPEGFINSQTAVTDEKEIFVEGLDDEGNPIQIPKMITVYFEDENGDLLMRQKTWAEYVCNQVENHVDGVNKLIRVGHRLGSGYYHHLTSEEFYQWADYFGIKNILTKSEAEHVTAKVVCDVEDI